jgi:quercetin dioxygenase-like cupin family protein
MQNKFNESTAQRPEGDRLIDAALVTIDLPLFMEQIKEETPWKERDRNAITVFKTNGLRIVVIALHKGAEMTRHTADGIISLQVLEGRLQFSTDRRSVQLIKGEMLTLHERIPHSVLAVEETIYLLTLATTVAIESTHL